MRERNRIHDIYERTGAQSEIINLFERENPHIDDIYSWINTPRTIKHSSASANNLKLVPHTSFSRRATSNAVHRYSAQRIKPSETNA